MTRAQRITLARIAGDVLRDRGDGTAYVTHKNGGTASERALEAAGLIVTFEVSGRFGGTSAMAGLTMLTRQATLTDAGWEALKDHAPTFDQLAFIARHRTSACARDWTLFRSVLAKGWVEEVRDEAPWAIAWRKHSVRWRRTEAGKAALREYGISLRPHVLDFTLGVHHD